jgi:PAS domain S-box-containing protein
MCAAGRSVWRVKYPSLAVCLLSCLFLCAATLTAGATDQWFGLSKCRLPPGSIVKFGMPSAWGLNKWWIIGGAIFVSLQAAFIIYLLVQSKHRTHESQQRFEIMANSAPVMIWMSGTDKLCTFFNQQWLSYTGRSLEQEMGDGWLNGVHPNDVDECMRTYVSSFDARLPFTMEYRLRRSDGEFGWITDHGVPRYAPTGEFAGYIGSSTDITERRRAEQGMLDLSGRLINAQEEERARIARELHDDFSQRIAVLAMQLGQVSMSLPESNKAASQRLHLIWERITELSSDIHKLSHRLHSSKLHHLGLMTAAKSLCEETAKQHDIQIEFAASDVPDEISPDVALCFFRIIQEALNNIAKHSGAKRAYVQLSTVDSRIRLRIVDAGVGFDTNSQKAKGGLGLASMRERLRIMGGMLEIRSRPMEGTEIQAEAPMPSMVAEASA